MNGKSLLRKSIETIAIAFAILQLRTLYRRHYLHSRKGVGSTNRNCASGRNGPLLVSRKGILWFWGNWSPMNTKIMWIIIGTPTIRPNGVWNLLLSKWRRWRQIIMRITLGLKKNKVTFNRNPRLSHIVSKCISFYSKKPSSILLQQDGFLDKQLIPVSQLDKSQRPINQHWSLGPHFAFALHQTGRYFTGFLFFEDRFSISSWKKHFLTFANPLRFMSLRFPLVFTSIQAAKLGRMELLTPLPSYLPDWIWTTTIKEVEEGSRANQYGWNLDEHCRRFLGDGCAMGNCILPRAAQKFMKQWDAYAFKLSEGQILKG